MGQYDKKQKSYLDDNVRFAEIFNKSIYNGQQVVNPDNLQEINVQHAQSERIRDLAKKGTVKNCGGIIYAIFGIENMQNMIYDAPPRKDNAVRCGRI